MNFFIKSYFFLFLLLGFCSLKAQSVKIINSDNSGIELEITFSDSYNLKDTIFNGQGFKYIRSKGFGKSKVGEPIIPFYNYMFCVKDTNVDIKYKIIETRKIPNINIIPKIFDSHLEFSSAVYNSNANYPYKIYQSNFQYFRDLQLLSLNISPFIFLPTRRKLSIAEKIYIKISYSKKSINLPFVKDDYIERFIARNILNKDYYSNSIKIQQTNKLINSTKKNGVASPFIKLFVMEKKLYKISYNLLKKYNFPVNTSISDIRLVNDTLDVPIDILDKNNNGFFDGEDEIFFIGFPPKATAYSTLNIYNNYNVYKLYFNKSDKPVKLYSVKNGKSNIWQNEVSSNINNTIIEKDLVYERLGYAPDDKRDNWFMGKISTLGGMIYDTYTMNFDCVEDSTVQLKIKIDLHGITNNNIHNVVLQLNGMKICNARWSGQKEFSQLVTIQPDTFKGQIYKSKPNVLKFYADNTEISGFTDEVRLNRVIFETKRNNYLKDFNYDFQLNKLNTISKINLYNCRDTNTVIYVPEISKKINSFYKNKNGQSYQISFIDTLSSDRQYFVSSLDMATPIDSLSYNLGNNLKNQELGADYIIITHPDFFSQAEKLAEYRKINCAGINSPRVKVINVNDIYDEFSGSLLDPQAIKSFLSYTYDNWKKPAPYYVVLLGDMSWDYRHILSDSRKNFIPSISYYELSSYKYGQAFSDNAFVCLKGDDILPEMSIGRLSCENSTEAEILINKTINYGKTGGKVWKQNAILIGAGEKIEDQTTFGFNESILNLDKKYFKNSGYPALKIFPFPINNEQKKYEGAKSEIITGFNKGASLVTFYGHGGGYQWDQIFYNDDIYQLNNEGKYPFISSMTCYTAHFDNQNVFGEQFVKAENKGAVAFWGHSAIASWDAVSQINEDFTKELIINNAKSFGEAINNSKIVNSYCPDEIMLLELLGDPALEPIFPKKSDYSIIQEDISYLPHNPVIGDTLKFKIRLKNYGNYNSKDSVLLSIKLNNGKIIFENKIPAFGEEDSLTVPWISDLSGNFTISFSINADKTVFEDDYSDNLASISIFVSNFKEGKFILPENGLSTNQKRICFKIANFAPFNYKKAYYYIQIDTNRYFNSTRIIKSPSLYSTNSIIDWISPELQNGIYFWRSRIMSDNKDSSNWSDIKTFSIGDSSAGFVFKAAQLKIFSQNNTFYSDLDSGLVLNNLVLATTVNKSTLLDTFNISKVSDYNTTAIASDGKYIYTGLNGLLKSLCLQNGVPIKSRIYKFGTGYSGTIKGKLYGSVGNNELTLTNNFIAFSDGNLYSTTENQNELIKMDISTGDTARIKIPNSLGKYSNKLTSSSSFEISTDGTYVYNLYTIDTLSSTYYKIKKLDPANNWKIVADIFTTSEIYKENSTIYTTYCSFFVKNNNAYILERYTDNYVRKVDLKTGNQISQVSLNNEFRSYKGFFGSCVDYKNDKIYLQATIYNNNSYIYVFPGSTIRNSGIVETPSIGPASKWKSVSYDINSPRSNTGINAELWGKGKTDDWQLINDKYKSNSNLDTLNPKFEILKLKFNLYDTSTVISNRKLIVKSIKGNYIYQPDISILTEKSEKIKDSVLQGDDIIYAVTVKNFGMTKSDSLFYSFIINNKEYTRKSEIVKVTPDFTGKTLNPDSVLSFNLQINTSNFTSRNNITFTLKSKSNDLIDFNNNYSNNFFVAKDSLKPTLNVTFDNVEILNNDLVSNKPKICITMKDNSPLQISNLDTALIKIYLNNNLLSYKRDSLNFSFTQFPDAKMQVTFNPKLKETENILKVIGIDKSKDTTHLMTNFRISDKNSIEEIYNYPNPFTSKTYFTFQLTGGLLPEYINFDIFTIAGRKIKAIKIFNSNLRYGFNKILWDGNDEDGNNIANGIYFCKITYNGKEGKKTQIIKMAKVR